jgi:hypothetical protein
MAAPQNSNTPMYSGMPAARFRTPTPEPDYPPLHPPYDVVLSKPDEARHIYVYSCTIHDPEDIADLLADWEKDKGVDLLGVDPESRWSGPDLGIPDRAWILIVAEDILETPRASAVFWATTPEDAIDGDEDHDPTEKQWIEDLQLRIGFYYGLERNEGTDFSIKEWADAMVETEHLVHMFTLGAGEKMSIEPMLSMTQEAFHNELCWREVSLPLVYASGDAEKKCVYRKRGRADKGLCPEPVQLAMLGSDPRLPC